jgi:hypothetical protein
MARTKSRCSTPLFESLYFQISSAKRAYAYGIEHGSFEPRPRPATYERESVVVSGSIRHVFRKPVACCEIKLAGEAALEPKGDSVQRSIGYVEFAKDTLRAYVSLPVATFRALAPDLTSGQFKEVSLRLIELKRGTALIDCIRFESDLTPSDDLG